MKVIDSIHDFLVAHRIGNELFQMLSSIFQNLMPNNILTATQMRWKKPSISGFLEKMNVNLIVITELHFYNLTAPHEIRRHYSSRIMILVASMYMCAWSYVAVDWLKIKNRSKILASSLSSNHQISIILDKHQLR